MLIKAKVLWQKDATNGICTKYGFLLTNMRGEKPITWLTNKPHWPRNPLFTLCRHLELWFHHCSHRIKRGSFPAMPWSHQQLLPSTQVRRPTHLPKTLWPRSLNRAYTSSDRTFLKFKNSKHKSFLVNMNRQKITRYVKIPHTPQKDTILRNHSKCLPFCKNILKILICILTEIWTNIILLFKRMIYIYMQVYWHKSVTFLNYKGGKRALNWDLSSYTCIYTYISYVRASLVAQK